MMPAATFISHLLNPEIYPHPVNEIELIETHISWVLLTGQYVYKIKKPVDLGFLDFSTLEKRKFYCEEEIRLNKRLAPEYYLDVISLYNYQDQTTFETHGEAIEYAVKMRQFPQEAQLDRMLESGNLKTQHMHFLAKKIAHFHTGIATIYSKTSFDINAQIHEPVIVCYQEILERMHNDEIITEVETLKTWSNNQFQILTEMLKKRYALGYIRECHGDLHLRNIAIVDEEVIAFDGIEFNDNLRWIDVISEIAFLLMDLDDHHQHEFSMLFLNRYLQYTGDYAGLAILNYYLVYRAIVRAMVSAIRLSQAELTPGETTEENKAFHNYLSLAKSYTKPTMSAIIITYGFSGSGKTFVADKLALGLSAIHIRSDIERKRIAKMDQLDRGSKSIESGIYNKETSDKTYTHLLELSERVTSSNFPVIIDATFLKESYRESFKELAEKQNIPFIILNIQSDINIMKDRIKNRLEHNTDASDADINILEHQLNAADALNDEEKENSITINNDGKLDFNKLAKSISTLINQ